MTFEAWLARLRNDGYLLCPASTAVPVELRAVRPDGWGLHLCCRGVRVQLGLYRPGRPAWQVPLWDRDVLPEDALELWEHRPLPPAGMDMREGTRIVFSGAHQTPDYLVVFDGGRERGWRSYEAGLLRPGDAAEIFAALLADVEPELAGWRLASPERRTPTGAVVSANPFPGNLVPSARTAAVRDARSTVATSH
ncbi:hypothetical protein [Pseudofrankia asymbiotica]|uniref:Uncharacterized protein n=1 Tax=Pseudofrankia asymbiotica TaxID=1834516 RepID=A0A1V2I4K7_9ACTN|nr:hypothetical protein [Pseudofrankia asymbiotica]ONH25826.1 hypothetical protein BL253_26165 [Pseudofrankia asymbiotica]